jgi:hypothetical protein
MLMSKGLRVHSRPRPGRTRDEDEDLRRAIEESKRMSRDEESKRAAVSQEWVGTAVVGHAMFAGSTFAPGVLMEVFLGVCRRH